MTLQRIISGDIPGKQRLEPPSTADIRHELTALDKLDTALSQGLRAALILRSS
ncbi:MAG: hypothetical protein HRT36_07230 [Alphaproteobacteria bacterium]|nr:hypothetical protein [Alphaproteobacteria bacterium]